MQLLQLLAPEQAYFTSQPGALEGVARGVAESAPSYFGAKGLESDQLNKPWDLQSGLDFGGNALLTAAPFLSAIPGFGPFLTAGAGLLGGGLKIGSKLAGNKPQSRNYNAQFNPMQQQLMNLGPSQSYNSPLAGQLNVNPGFQGTKLKPLGALA